ncbi:DUF6787 family protein [uncultured Maribacter sp.]|uniref:DUF6787 family protein n=1 Tax=uncultured Maribacter sp. TaxID=431308 RepID=UPI002619F191|nr:DUF6787 family protein [uncultured Maribacter sp.]
MEKLKQRWGLDSNIQIILVLIVFSITGSAAVFLAKPILNSIGLVRETFPEAWWGTIIYVILRILIIFPIYQVLLVVFGWLFGQFKFFWNFEKKMLNRLGLGFLFK